MTRLLEEELGARRVRNPAYSLRAFARDLGLNVTSLSQAMSGKRALRGDNLRKVFASMRVSDADREFLLRESSRRGQYRKVPDSYRPIDRETFESLRHEIFFPLLSLCRLENRADPDWIAARLGVDAAAVRETLAAVKRLGYVEETEGRLRRTIAPISFHESVQKSEPIRRYHLSNLEKARKALTELPTEARHFATITMPVNPERWAEAEKRIRHFAMKLSAFLEKGATSEVATLSVQLFPNTLKVSPA